jgi:hypothetical protein
VRAWFHCTGAELLAREAADTVGRLASAQQARGYPGTPDQEFAWRHQLAALREALRGIGETWTIALEYDLLRLEKRIDAVVLTDRAIIVLEFKSGAVDRAALAEAEDYALDLRDFHAGSRRHPIVPILVAGDADFVPPAQPPLIWDGVQQPLVAGHGSLGAALRCAHRASSRRSPARGRTPPTSRAPPRRSGEPSPTRRRVAKSTLSSSPAFRARARHYAGSTPSFPEMPGRTAPFSPAMCRW